MKASEHFVVFPTIGQVFSGSVLVAPKCHVETLARLPANLQIECAEVIFRMMRPLKNRGNVAVFEHGATHETGGGCGIYHAHAHLIPLPQRLSLEDLAGARGVSYPSLGEAWGGLAHQNEYLLMADSKGRTEVIVDTHLIEGFGSQFVRRALADFFGVDKPWDWRQYNNVEQELVDTHELLRKNALP